MVKLRSPLTTSLTQVEKDTADDGVADGLAGLNLGDLYSN